MTLACKTTRGVPYRPWPQQARPAGPTGFARRRARWCQTWVSLARSPGHLIRRHQRSPAGSFRAVRTLGIVPCRCPNPSGLTAGRSPGWLPAWLPGRQLDPLLAKLSARANKLPARFRLPSFTWDLAFRCPAQSTRVVCRCGQLWWSTADFGPSCRCFGAGVGVELVVGHDAPQGLGGLGLVDLGQAAAASKRVSSLLLSRRTQSIIES